MYSSRGFLFYLGFVGEQFDCPPEGGSGWGAGFSAWLCNPLRVGQVMAEKRFLYLIVKGFFLPLWGVVVAGGGFLEGD